MRLRVLDFGVDKYGLNAYIFDSTNDGTTNYDQVLFSPTKDGADARRRPSRKGQWADVKVKIIGRRARRQDRRHAGQGRGADARPVARPPVPHLGQPRASRPGRPGPASPASPATSPSTSPRRSRPRPPPTSRSSRPAITSEETYVEQGLYWATGHLPMLKYVVQDLQAGPAARRLSRRPTSSSTSSSAWSRTTLPNGAAEPGLRRRRPQRRPGRPGRRSASAFIRERLRWRPTRP